MCSEPLVTVITPCYNHAPYLADYFEGLLAQTYRNVQLLFHDDGSIDGSLKIARSYESRLREHFADVNITTGSNAGFFKVLIRTQELVAGEYVCILESDDYYYPHKLARTVAFLIENPNYGAVHTETDYLKSDGIERRHWESSGTAVSAGSVLRELIRVNFIMTCSFCCRSELFKRYVSFDLYSNSEYLMADYPMFLDIAAHEEIGYIDESLSVYRVVDESASRSQLEPAQDTSVSRFPLSDKVRLHRKIRNGSRSM